MAKIFQLNVRLDADTLDTLKAIQDSLHISQADVVRLAVRAMAKKEGAQARKNKPEKSARAH